MTDYCDVIINFKNYCTLNGIKIESSKLEESFLGIFLRKSFLTLCLSTAPLESILQFIEISFNLVEKDKIDHTVPFLLIEDLIEIGPYSILHHLLPFLNEKSQEWVSKLTSKKGAGLILLRSVNHLRRKIAKSEHSKIAGLSLLLLTKIFPASERSGVNLKGEKNHENEFLNTSSKVESFDDFPHFVNLHRLFYIPSSICFDNENLNNFCCAVEKILKKIELAASKPFTVEQIYNSDRFFALHHLFTANSFELQIEDHLFRLTLLAQILVALQDFNCFLNHKNILELEKLETLETWIAETTKRTYYLISLHNYGKDYFRFVRSIFRNEKNWINWKSNSCPPFEKEFLPIFSNNETLNISNNMQSYSVFNMGDAELSRLWKYSLFDIDNRQLKPDIDNIFDNNDENTDSNSFWRTNRLKWKLKL